MTSNSNFSILTKVRIIILLILNTITMKTKNMLALAALVTLGLSACSNEEDVQFRDMQDTPITYTAAINELTSRTGIALNEGSFGLFLTTEGTEDSKYTANNMEVSYAYGSWKPASQLLWKDNNSSVSYYAYRPYQTTGTDATKFPVTVQTTQTAETMEADDFCYAEKCITTATSNEGSINVEFNHLLAKLNVVLTAASELPEETTFNTVTIENSIMSATCNLNDGQLTKSATKQSLVLKKEENGTNFEGILIPQSFTNLTVTISASNGKKYQFKSQETLDLKSGKEYRLNLIVGRDKVTMGEITAQSWQSENGGSLVVG